MGIRLSGMNDQVSELLDGLRRALADFAELAQAASAAGEETKGEIAARVKGALSEVREKLDHVERSLAHGARTAEHYVRENPWLAIGGIALIAYLLGSLSRRDR
jgi:ElaB/YqjD/DUF883 family membrane-anchored ribosome-binding protein